MTAPASDQGRTPGPSSSTNPWKALPAPLRVGVLDDHRCFGDALNIALNELDDVRCIGAAATCDELIDLAVKDDPDVLLLDYRLSGETGINCASALRDAGVGARLILLTDVVSVDVRARALDHGFEQVVNKGVPLADLVNAIRFPRLRPTPVIDDGWVNLSKRQREVLGLMGQGLAPATIAKVLFISIHTARSHVKDVLHALGAPTQLAAVTTAIRDGYLLPPSKSDTPIQLPAVG